MSVWGSKRTLFSTFESLFSGPGFDVARIEVGRGSELPQLPGGGGSDRPHEVHCFPKKKRNLCVVFRDKNLRPITPPGLRIGHFGGTTGRGGGLTCSYIEPTLNPQSPSPPFLFFFFGPPPIFSKLKNRHPLNRKKPPSQPTKKCW